MTVIGHLPYRIADTSWIKPGRCSWVWWSYPDEPTTEGRFNEFTDFAARMGWEYTLFDAPWRNTGLQRIVHHAEAKGVMPMAWHIATGFYDAETRTKKLDAMKRAGVRGVKVDFCSSERQEAAVTVQQP